MIYYACCAESSSRMLLLLLLLVFEIPHQDRSLMGNVIGRRLKRYE